MEVLGGGTTLLRVIKEDHTFHMPLSRKVEEVRGKIK